MSLERPGQENGKVRYGDVYERLRQKLEAERGRSQYVREYGLYGVPGSFLYPGSKVPAEFTILARPDTHDVRILLRSIRLGTGFSVAIILKPDGAFDTKLISSGGWGGDRYLELPADMMPHVPTVMDILRYSFDIPYEQTGEIARGHGYLQPVYRTVQFSQLLEHLADEGRERSV